MTETLFITSIVVLYLIFISVEMLRFILRLAVVAVGVIIIVTLTVMVSNHLLSEPTLAAPAMDQYEQMLAYEAARLFNRCCVQVYGQH